jgi:hypothetical protein
MGKMRNAFKILVGNPEGKRPLGRPGRRWENDIKIHLREIGRGGCGLDSSGSVLGPVAGTCERDNEPSVSIESREFLQ